MSLRNASKRGQRIPKERGQPESRKHFGLLEKKKDYRKRARVFHQKQDQLKALKKRALNRNPDEFNFHMYNSQVEDGQHKEKVKPTEYTTSRMKLMQTQDLNYINFKHKSELSKIEKLKANHHLIEAEGKPKNTHIFFVDTKAEARKFDVAKHLDTHPDLLDRPYNLLRRQQLRNLKIQPPDEESASTSQCAREYAELEKRLDRDKRLLVMKQTLEVKRQLQDKKCRPIKKIQDGSKEKPPIYQWPAERKK